MDLELQVSPRRWAVALGLVTALLVAASVGASYLSFVPIDDPLLRHLRDSAVRLTWVDDECNIPSWYSASLLLLCSLLLAVVAAAHRQHRAGYFGHWLALALIFLFLSLDETAQLHELSIAPLRNTFHTTGLLYYAWIIPAGICVALLGVSYLRFLRMLPARTRRLFLIAGAVYVGGALGVEAVSGAQASQHGEHNLTYHAIVTVEELLEMAGLVAFLYALLDYIGRQFTPVRFHLADR